MNLYRDAQEFPRTLRGRNLVATPADLAAGGMSPSAARWRCSRGLITRPHRGAYLLGPSYPDLLDRIRAALLVSPPDAVAGYHTAAALFGFGVATSADVHIVVASGGPFPQRPGIVAHQSVLPVGKPTMAMDIPCTSAARCAVDLARCQGRPDALSTLDAALAAQACTVDDLTAEVALHTGLRGIRQARALVAVADPRSRCRQESHLRLIMLDGGVSGMQPQLHVADDYGLIDYRLGLGDPVRRIGVEYGGASHLDRGRRRYDRERHNWLVTNGWRMYYFTDRDINGRAADIVRIVKSAR